MQWCIIESRLTLLIQLSLLKEAELVDLLPQIKYCLWMKSNKNLISIRNCIFGFQCEENWSEMAYISNADSGSEIRFCSSCEKEVYECTSDQELTDNVRINRCVVIARSTDTDDDILLGMIKPQVFKLRD